MKRLFFIFMLVCGIRMAAQNTAPTVSVQAVTVNQTLQTVTINYNLADAENQNCSVWLKVSQDGGTFYQQISALNLSGDVGSGIVPGTGKSMVWDYSSLTGNVFATKIRVYASDNQVVNISDMVSQVDSNSLKNYLSYIEGKRNVTNGLVHLNEIRDSIETNFLRYGLDTEIHNFSYSIYTGENILGRKQGAKDEAITYIIDAHYDGVAAGPAADDNGSGVAGVLEVLRILSQYDFEHSIRFIGFDFEEPGLVGSSKYVQSGIKSFENIQGVLNYEMIGFYSNQPNSQSIPSGFSTLFPQTYQAIINDGSRGNFLLVCGNTNSSTLSSQFLTVASQYVPALRALKTDVPGTGTIAPDFRRSDHAPFWDASKKALMLTDGADFRNANYHTPGDSSQTLNFTFMTNVVKATLATLADLAVPISAGHGDYDLATVAVFDHNHEFPASVTLFPNPNQGKLNLKVSTETVLPTRIEIFDLTGKVVWSKIAYFPQGESIQTFSIKDLPAASYMLILTSDDHTLSQGFVLEK